MEPKILEVTSTLTYNCWSALSTQAQPVRSNKENHQCTGNFLNTPKIKGHLVSSKHIRLSQQGSNYCFFQDLFLNPTASGTLNSWGLTDNSTTAETPSFSQRVLNSQTWTCCLGGEQNKPALGNGMRKEELRKLWGFVSDLKSNVLFLPPHTHSNVPELFSSFLLTKQTGVVVPPW